MDKILKSLFSYQEFERDPELILMKDDAESRYSALLTDNELALVHGGSEENAPKLNDTVYFYSGGEKKQGTIENMNENQYLIKDFGWVNKNDICQ